LTDNGDRGGFLKAGRLPRDVCRTVLPLACSTTKYGSPASTSSPKPCVCWNVTSRAGRRRSFATLRTPDPGNARRLQKWITAARAASLPHVHAFTRGLDLDSQAATAALTLAYHNGRTEGVMRPSGAKRQLSRYERVPLSSSPTQQSV
jgi:hypothetical protein